MRVEGPPFFPRDRIQPHPLPRPLPVAREEVGGVRELESGDRVGNILAENANAEDHSPTSLSPSPPSFPPPLALPGVVNADDDGSGGGGGGDRGTQGGSR